MLPVPSGLQTFTLLLRSSLLGCGSGLCGSGRVLGLYGAGLHQARNAGRLLVNLDQSLNDCLQLRHFAAQLLDFFLGCARGSRIHPLGVGERTWRDEKQYQKRKTCC